MPLGRIYGNHIWLPLDFRTKDGGSLRIQCLVDTGYNGEVILPKKWLKNLDTSLRHCKFKGLTSAFGEKIDTICYDAIIIWNNTNREILVTVPRQSEKYIGHPIVGMQLLNPTCLCFVSSQCLSPEIYLKT